MKYQDFIQDLMEAFSPGTTESALVSIFKKHYPDFVAEPRRGNLSMNIDPVDENGEETLETLKKLSPAHKALLKDIMKYSKTHDMLSMTSSVGFWAGNTISVNWPVKPARARNAFHMTSRKNVAGILKNGLKATRTSGHSETFSPNVSGGRIQTELSRAVFAVGTMGGVKKLPTWFKYVDPVILQINPAPYTWWQDPLLPDNFKSILTYENIKASDIQVLP